MANEDSRESSVLKSALTVAGAGLIAAAGIGIAKGGLKGIGKTLKEGVDEVKVKNVDEVSNKVDKEVSKEVKEKQAVVVDGKLGNDAPGANVIDLKNAEDITSGNVNPEPKIKTTPNTNDVPKDIKPTYQNYDDVNVDDNFVDKNGNVFVLINKSRENPTFNGKSTYAYESLSGKHAVNIGSPIGASYTKVDNKFTAAMVTGYRNASKDLAMRSEQLTNSLAVGVDESKVKNFINGQYKDAYESATKWHDEIKAVDDTFTHGGKTQEHIDNYLNTVKKYTEPVSGQRSQTGTPEALGGIGKAIGEKLERANFRKSNDFKLLQAYYKSKGKVLTESDDLPKNWKEIVEQLKKIVQNQK